MGASVVGRLSDTEKSFAENNPAALSDPIPGPEPSFSSPSDDRRISNRSSSRHQRLRLWRRSFLVGVSIAGLLFFVVNWRMISLLEEIFFKQKDLNSGLFYGVSPPSVIVFVSEVVK